MAKRRRKSRAGFLMILGLAMLIAGFLARRTFLPLAMFRLTHRAPQHSQDQSTASQVSPSEIENAPSQHGNVDSQELLTDRDRRELEATVRKKSQ